MNKVSIVMTALNEEYIAKTVDTILQRTPFDMIGEILLIDDDSDIPVQLQYPKCRVIRNSTREGLIRARNFAATEARYPFVVSMDPHVKVGVEWLEPIVDRLQSKHNCIAVPMTRGLDPVEWSETSEEHAKTGWKWDLDFYWRRNDPGDETPAFAGHCFAFTKRWFEESGGFDTGMYKWGGENIEFSLRTWLLGGSVEIVRDSAAAHWFKPRFVNYQMDHTTLQKNKARIAEVWFDDYKKYFYQALRKKPGDIDFGDVTSRMEIRRLKQEKPFEWFLDRFQPELKNIMCLRNKHAGAKVAVLGAGPSLDHVNKKVLDQFDVVIGVNYNALAFDCDYVVFHDMNPARAVLDSKKYSDSQLVVPERLKDGNGRWCGSANEISSDLTIYQLGAQDKDSSLNSKDPPFFHHASTVHTAVHFAAFIGAGDVTLYGCDAKLAPDGRSHTKLVKQYRGGYYWPKGKDTENYLRRIDRGYDMLRVALEKWRIPLLKLEYV